MILNGFVREHDNLYYYLDGELITSRWFMDENGKYHYAGHSGKLCVGKCEINEVPYYFNSDSTLYEGWKYLTGSWYYFTENGALTGYQSIGEYGRENQCYFLQDGRLVVNEETPDGRMADSDGYLLDNDTTTFEDLPGFEMELSDTIQSGALSGIRISGMPVEFYMLSIAGETSGGRIVMGDRGRAYGLCQYDYRYDLVSFMKWAYARHPSLWFGFENYLSYEAGDDCLIGNDGILSAFTNARNLDYEAAISDELEYMRELYWDGFAERMNAAGYHLSERHIAVSAALFSVNINCGKHLDLFLSSLSPEMTDAQMICEIYKIRNTVLAQEYVGNVQKGTTARYRLAEPRMALDLLHGYTTVDSVKSYGGGVQWNGNLFSGKITTCAVEGNSTEWETIMEMNENATVATPSDCPENVNGKTNDESENEMEEETSPASIVILAGQGKSNPETEGTDSESSEADMLQETEESEKIR